MAHEELKALYEIDKQHSDTPWEFWEFFSLDKWVKCRCQPSWAVPLTFRRKPDAPVWPDDKEDARKWRELMKQIEDSRNSINNSSCCYVEPEKPKLIQGYTEEQWQRIIDGEFLCEFSDADWHIENNYADRIVQVLTGITDGRFTGNDYHWPYCRPLRIKGVRQPWFGGECPVGREVYVHATYDNAAIVYGPARNMGWPRVVEFIEL